MKNAEKADVVKVDFAEAVEHIRQARQKALIV